MKTQCDFDALLFPDGTSETRLRRIRKRPCPIPKTEMDWVTTMVDLYRGDPLMLDFELRRLGLTTREGVELVDLYRH